MNDFVGVSFLLAIAALFAPKAAPAPSTAALDAPILVVERNSVIWAEKCEGGTLPEDAGVRATALSGTSGLQFVGNGRSAEATLGEAFCMQGECGASQVALPLLTGGDAEAAGVVLSRAALGKSTVHPLELAVIEGNDSYGDGRLVAGLRTALPECDAPPKADLPEGTIWDCRTYRENRGTFGVQVMGIGVVQENQYPSYKTVRFRVLEKDKKTPEWKPGEWQAQPRGVGTRLPTPVGVLDGGKSPARVVWLHQEGICCPSSSSAWITEVGAKKVREGALHEAGFGQPCD